MHRILRIIKDVSPFCDKEGHSFIAVEGYTFDFQNRFFEQIDDDKKVEKNPFFPKANKIKNSPKRPEIRGK